MLYYAGLFLFLTGRYDKAKEYIDRMLKVSPPTREGLILKGWNEILNTKDKKSAIVYFESTGAAMPEALFGKAKCFERNSEHMKALEVINQAVVLYSGFVPALLEKMKIHLAMSDWDQMLDSCNRALSQDANSIEALVHIILHLVCKNGDYKEGSDRLSELLPNLEKVEPKNGNLYHRIAMLLSRTCSRQDTILQHTFVIAERACSLEPSNADYMAELGYQRILQGKLKDAAKYYRAALKVDEASITALTGVIWCQLLEGQYDVASQQLELLKEIHKTSSMTPELLYLSALSLHKELGKPEELQQYLSQCVDTHFLKMEGLSLGSEYLLLLNPDFIFQIVHLYLQYSPDKPIEAGQTMPESLKKSQTILQPVTRSCPGCVEAMYLMGKLKYLSGDLVAAQGLLEKCSHQYSSFADAQMLLAQIHLHQGNVKSASQMLETALSYNFEVRDQPTFHLIKAKILKHQGEFQEALQLLNAAMTLSGKKTSNASQKKPKHELGTSDRVSLYLELADTYRKLDQQDEAVKVMQEAVGAFRGTPEEVRVTIASSELALSRGNIDEALTLLRNIGPDQPYFQQAREKMADIYLTHRKDPRLYASCYREVIEKFPVPQSYLMLGDAYMKIQEPDNAIGAYEQALRKNPRDSMIARKIGQALIKTHQFERAITYYKAAIKAGGQPLMKYDLAELLAKVKRLQDAEDMINAALEGLQKESDLASLQWESKFQLLLAQVHQTHNKDDLAVRALNRAFETQSRAQIYRNIAYDLLCLWCHNWRRLFGKILLLLINIFDCSTILLVLEIFSATLRWGSPHQRLSVLRYNLKLQAKILPLILKIKRCASIKFLTVNQTKILKIHAQSKSKLGMLLRVVTNGGVLHYLEQLVKSVLLQKQFWLNYRYTGNPAGAMKSFNKARHDSDWGLISTYHMIEICINPDNETIGGETFNNGDIGTRDTAKIDYREGAIQTAERLLNELRPKISGDSDFRLMSNFIHLAKKTKTDAEIALNEFLLFTSDERNRDHVGAILGMATAHMILKQVPRARHQLKRVMKAPWNFGDAEYLEKCWTLLADIYIQSGKYDVATDLLKKTLQYNKASGRSCTKAYEYMGYIMEKEQSFKEAALYYESAWKQGSQNNPAMGYKLAFNYLKAKRYTDAIDVCHVVLTKCPSYPKIRKDILEKARSNLRT
ncbi:unnamed protein product [Ixodes hexagonus]